MVIAKILPCTICGIEIGIAHGKKHFGNKLQCCSLLREGYHTQQQIMICRQNEDDYNKIMT